ncbi:hypothetical protein ACIRPH_09335 [Nocardiopsis sp. NPDC101807]|uniref:hypothetical protein n=1 Tax=Nocardiopsis sp. NPDC101807 TaxID=3364339 RepID=UPI00381A7CFC
MNHLQWMKDRFPGVGSGEDPADWDALEAESGISFPEDYKALHDHFGPFALDDGFAVLGPAAIVRVRAGDREDLGRATGGKDGFFSGSGIGSTRLEVEGEFVYFDDLLRFGTTDVAYSLYWHTSSDDPHEWGIVVGDTSSWYVFDMGITAFLVSLLLRNLSCPPLVQDGWPDEDTELSPLR